MRESRNFPSDSFGRHNKNASQSKHSRALTCVKFTSTSRVNERIKEKYFENYSIGQSLH